MRRLTAILAMTLGLGACESAETVLVVQVRTDLVPGRDFEAVVVDLEGTRRELAAGTARDWGAGVRVAEVTGLPPGATRFSVAAVDTSGATVVARPVRVEIRAGVTVATVLLSVACGGVECPTAGADPNATACVAGRCVVEECVGERADACGTECAADADCPAGLGCARAACVGGLCFFSPDHAACDAAEVCDSASHCVPHDRAGLAPTGPGHALVSVATEADGRVLRVDLSTGDIEDLSAHASARLGRAGAPDDQDLQASRDGRWLYFVDVVADFGLVRLDVTGAQPPTRFLGDGDIYPQRLGMVVGDDGASVVLVERTPDGWGLFPFDTASPGGLGPEITASSPFDWNRGPTMLGDRLLFACGATSYYDTALCTVDPAGGVVDVLRPSPGPEAYVSRPTVEAAGTILFSSDEGGYYQVYRIAADGSGATPVSADTLLEPCALPDGRWIARRDAAPPVIAVFGAGDVLEADVPLPADVSSRFGEVVLSGCSP